MFRKTFFNQRKQTCTHRDCVVQTVRFCYSADTKRLFNSHCHTVLGCSVQISQFHISWVECFIGNIHIRSVCGCWTEICRECIKWSRSQRDWFNHNFVFEVSVIWVDLYTWLSRCWNNFLNNSCFDFFASLREFISIY